MAYITRQQAAERLSVSLRTLDGIIQRGTLPAYRVGAKLVRIKESDLEDYMAGRLVAPAPAKKNPDQSTNTRRCTYIPGMKVV